MEISAQGSLPLDETSFENFEELKHYVGREVLQFYDRAKSWTWYYLIDKSISLARLASAFHRRDHFFIMRLINKGALKVYRSLDLIPGRGFHCIFYRESVFFLEPAGTAEEVSSEYGTVEQFRLSHEARCWATRTVNKVG